MRADKMIIKNERRKGARLSRKERRAAWRREQAARLRELRGPEHELKPGSIILSKDRKTRYQLQADGSRKKISDQTPGEFEQVVKESAVEYLKTHNRFA